MQNRVRRETKPLAKPFNNLTLKCFHYWLHKKEKLEHVEPLQVSPEGFHRNKNNIAWAPIKTLSCEILSRKLDAKNAQLARQASPNDLSRLFPTDTLKARHRETGYGTYLTTK